MYCLFCGTSLPEGALFCLKCGQLTPKREQYLPGNFKFRRETSVALARHRRTMMKQRETILICKTCGTENSVFEPYCKVCQNVLEGSATLQAIDKKLNYSAFSKHYPMPGSVVIARLKEKQLWLTIPIILIVPALLIVLISQFFTPAHSRQSPHGTSSSAISTSTEIGKDGIGVTEVDKDYIGISDGRFVLDPKRPDAAYKIQAAASLRNGNIGVAMTQWNSALAIDSNDAEPLIYLENQRVLASGSPFITFVVDVTLSANVIDGRSRSILQGAYIAQKENNDSSQLSGGIKIRLLIATIGSNLGQSADRSADLAHQIVQAAQSDKTIVGVLSALTSVEMLSAIPVLAQAHIPVVAAVGASGDVLTNLSPYFFRITTSDKVLTSLLTTYIEQKLKPQRLALFVDNNEPFSRDLADSFRQKYTSDGYGNFSTQEFQVGGNPEVLHQSVQDVLSRYHPDVIFFTSNIVNDFATLLNAIPSTPQFSDLKVVGGFPAYELVEGAGKQFTGYTRLRFEAGGFPDEWLLYSKQPPPFFTDYPRAFDPQGKHTGSPYGYTRPDPYAMLAYDTIKTLSAGSQLALAGGKRTFTSDELRQALAQINGPRAVRGITGIISLGADGNPVNKADLVLRVDSTAHLQMDAVQGCFDTVNCSNKIVFLN